MDESVGEIRAIYSDAVGNDDETMMEFDVLMDQHDRGVRDSAVEFTEDELALARLIFASEYNPIDDNVEEAFMSVLRVIRPGARVARPATPVDPVERMGRIVPSAHKPVIPIGNQRGSLGHAHRLPGTITGAIVGSSPSLIPIGRDGVNTGRTGLRTMKRTGSSVEESSSTGFDVKEGE
jgi:hypothetical protein